MKYTIIYGISSDINNTKSFNKLSDVIKYMDNLKSYSFIDIYDNDPSGEISLIFANGAFHASYFVQEKYGECFFGKYPVDFYL